ncbi:MAG: diguanylate cyclase [Desulfobacterales bacterium]|jgi:diguanylate cyclase (GGDEF)-like protein
MKAQDLAAFLETAGKDPSRLIFEDELTGIYNRRFLLHYLDSRIEWDRLNGRKISLVMMDLDHFKSINDTYGHLVGDRALIWLAEHLKAAAGKDGYPIRYAGDEFMLLLEASNKPLAVSLAQKLLDRVHAHPFSVPDVDTSLPITLSLGVSTAPSDATDWKSFIQSADTALYLAKRRGRDQVVDASEADAAEAGEKTIVFQLGTVKVVGRNSQLKTVREALKEFRQENSVFVLVKGAAGMGKTAFIDAVRTSLGRNKIFQASAHGAPQQMFRPYYLVEQIIVDLLNQQADKGMAALSELEESERGFLSLIMPRLTGAATVPEELDESARRKGIFETLARLFALLAEDRPLFLFIDDIHFADEAALLLIRRLRLRKELKLFVLAAASEDSDADTGKDTYPLERFVRDHAEELGIVPVTLTPLSDGDIAQQIRSLFPDIGLPDDFCAKLSQISQGNPLFLAEILRKMVLDRQITLVGQKWTLHPVQEGYLPQSMEEIVTEKITALDQESRELLDQVSALGEQVPLSMLVGSSSLMEAKVLAFIDQAVAQGLLASDFTINDENIRFLSKRVLEITYNAIDPNERKKLHSKIGSYQEGLFKKLQSPAATLAYHFKRSDDTKKAERYEQIQSESNRRNFNAQEAIEYSGEAPAEQPPEEKPLSAEGLTQIPQFVRNFTVALRNIKLYPPGSKSVLRVNQDLKGTIDQIHQHDECLSISQANRALVINGQRMDTSDFKMVAESLIQILDRFELKGVAFHRGLTDQELEALTEEMGRSEQKIFEDTHWEVFSKTHGLRHIDLKQMRYAMQAGAGARQAAGKGGAEEAGARMAPEVLAQLPDILRALLSAARTIKLYPITSNASKNTIKTLSDTLRRFLSHYSLLSLSHVGSSLLVNGEKIDVSEFKALAEGLIKYFTIIGLKSLTILDSFTDDELRVLIDALGKIPAAGAEAKFWKSFAKQQGMRGILFDQHTFEVRIKHTGAQGGPGRESRQRASEAAAAPAPESDTPPAELPLDVLLQNLPDIVSDLFLKDDREGVRFLLDGIFEHFSADAAVKEPIIDACRTAAEALDPAVRLDFTGILANPLIGAFLRETEPKAVIGCASLLHLLAAALIQFDDYSIAARILAAVRKRRQQLQASGSGVTPALGKNFDGLLHPSIQKLLVEDMLSGNTEKQKNAARLLAGFGEAALPMLVDIVKRGEDYRTRHLAAALLAKLDPSTSDRLKRALALEGPAKEKIRLLSVLDLLGADCRTEALRLLNDPDTAVRQAAFRLVERVKDPAIVDMLLDMAKEAREDVAVDAISCIARVNPPGAAVELTALIGKTKEEGRIRACCLALGEIGAPEGIAPLSKIIHQRGILFFRKAYSPEIKAAAAYALCQIRHPEAAEAVAALDHHPDPQICQIAKSAKASRSAPAQKQ